MTAETVNGQRIISRTSTGIETPRVLRLRYLDRQGNPQVTFGCAAPTCERTGPFLNVAQHAADCPTLRTPKPAPGSPLSAALPTPRIPSGTYTFTTGPIYPAVGVDPAAAPETRRSDTEAPTPAAATEATDSSSPLVDAVKAAQQRAASEPIRLTLTDKAARALADGGPRARDTIISDAITEHVRRVNAPGPDVDAQPVDVTGEVNRLITRLLNRSVRALVADRDQARRDAAAARQDAADARRDRDALVGDQNDCRRRVEIADARLAEERRRRAAAWAHASAMVGERDTARRRLADAERALAERTTERDDALRHLAEGDESLAEERRRLVAERDRLRKAHREAVDALAGARQDAADQRGRAERAECTGHLTDVRCGNLRRLAQDYLAQRDAVRAQLDAVTAERDGLAARAAATGDPSVKRRELRAQLRAAETARDVAQQRAVNAERDARDARAEAARKVTEAGEGVAAAVKRAETAERLLDMANADVKRLEQQHSDMDLRRATAERVRDDARAALGHILTGGPASAEALATTAERDAAVRRAETAERRADCYLRGLRRAAERRDALRAQLAAVQAERDSLRRRSYLRAMGL